MPSGKIKNSCDNVANNPFSVLFNVHLIKLGNLIHVAATQITVRLTGSAKSIDFVLTDTVKNTLLDMYDLYTAGGDFIVAMLS